MVFTKLVYYFKIFFLFLVTQVLEFFKTDFFFLSLGKVLGRITN